MDIVVRWFWIVLIIVLVVMIVNMRSKARDVIEALSNQSVANIKALQGNAPY